LRKAQEANKGLSTSCDEKDKENSNLREDIDRLNARPKAGLENGPNLQEIKNIYKRVVGKDVVLADMPKIEYTCNEFLRVSTEGVTSERKWVEEFRDWAKDAQSGKIKITPVEFFKEVKVGDHWGILQYQISIKGVSWDDESSVISFEKGLRDGETVDLKNEVSFITKWDPEGRIDVRLRFKESDGDDWKVMVKDSWSMSRNILNAPDEKLKGTLEDITSEYWIDETVRFEYIVKRVGFGALPSPP